MTDTQLLREYVTSGSQEAFAQLVGRHVDMVYSAARRQARWDAHLAEEITQQVFILLAKKAKSFDDRVLLGGWLFNCARLVARDVLRKESRRLRHEQKAAAMAEQLRKAGAPDEHESADDIEILDDAMSDLDEQTRGLLVLRYLQGRSASEVSAQLGISEDAARKRISRALEELRGLFARRGVIMPSTVVAETLAATAAIKAPTGLAASASSLAVSSSSTASTFTAGSLLMAIGKAKLATGVAIAVLAVGAVGVQQTYKYLSSPSPRVITGSKTQPKISGPTTRGTVYDPDGKPLAGAEIDVGFAGRQASAYPRKNAPQAFTDASGEFIVAKPDGPYVIVVRSPEGYAEVSSQALAAGAQLKVQAWGAIEGVVKAGNEVLPRTKVNLWRIGENEELVSHQAEVTADADGHFIFPQVAPGGVQIYRLLPGRSMRSADWQYVEVAPGQAAIANIGGSGASVVGRVDAPPAMASLIHFDEKAFPYEAEVRLELPQQRAKHEKGESPEQYRAIEEAFGRTEAGRIAKEWMFGSSFLVNPDGTFRIDNLPPGKYQFLIRNFEEQREVNFWEDIARAEGKFTVPSGAAPGAAPIDIGTFVTTVMSRLRPGDAAPQFTVKTIDGKTINSAELKGKLILVVFWGTWSNTHQLKAFGDFAQQWANDTRLVIIGDYLTDDDAHARKWIADAGLDFPQVKDDGLMKKFDSSWPEAVLVGMDGRIVQKHLKGKTLEKFVRQELGPGNAGDDVNDQSPAPRTSPGL